MRAIVSAGRGPFMTRSPARTISSGAWRCRSASTASMAAIFPWMSARMAIEGYMLCCYPGYLSLYKCSGIIFSHIKGGAMTLLPELFRYHAWATRQLIDYCLSQQPALLDEVVIG